MGAVGAGAMIPIDIPADADAHTHAHAHAATIADLVSTSEVFTPPRGRGYQKFSFDFPEPSVVFGDLKCGFLVFTDENTYGLDRTKLRAEGNDNELRVTCDGF